MTTENRRAKVAVLISGTGTNMAALLYASRQGAPFEIVLVASNDPHAGGLAIAEAEGIATFACSHKGMDRAGHDAAMDAAIRESGAQFVALAGYMRVIGDDFVKRWEGRMLNIHPSLLPKYKGLQTHARALEAGDEIAGLERTLSLSIRVTSPRVMVEVTSTPSAQFSTRYSAA